MMIVTVPPEAPTMFAAAGLPAGKRLVPVTVTCVVAVAGPFEGVGPEVTVGCVPTDWKLIGEERQPDVVFLIVNVTDPVVQPAAGVIWRVSVCVPEASAAPESVIVPPVAVTPVVPQLAPAALQT